jgi:hypothetical protein
VPWERKTNEKWNEEKKPERQRGWLCFGVLTKPGGPHNKILVVGDEVLLEGRESANLAMRNWLGKICVPNI